MILTSNRDVIVSVSTCLQEAGLAAIDGQLTAAPQDTIFYQPFKDDVFPSSVSNKER